MPFLHRRVVEEALKIPMELKRAGRFEAMLLNHIDPALAGHMSAYGHHFAGPPSGAHERDEWGTVVRPAWVRQKSYRVRRTLGQVTDEHGGLMTPAFLGRVIDLHFPAMRRFFDVAHAAGDAGLYRRIATLEYLADRLGSRLADAWTRAGQAPAGGGLAALAAASTSAAVMPMMRLPSRLANDVSGSRARLLLTVLIVA